MRRSATKEDSVEPLGLRRTGDPAPHAFSLVELLYALTLLGLLAAVAAPLVDVDRFRLNAAVTSIATELMAAQRTAVLRGHNVVVALDSSGNRIRVHSDVNNDRAIQMGEPWKWVELPEGVRFGLAGDPPPGGGAPPVTFQQRQGIYPAITFHRNGSASEEGFLYLRGWGRGARPAYDRAVEVVRSTAKVTCWSRQSGSWTETC